MYQKLEEALVNFTGAKSVDHVVVCNSGTAALHLALESLYNHIPVPLRQRSYIAVPDYCMVAVPRAVVLAGFQPVFIDCNLDDYNMNLKSLIKAYQHLKGDIFGTIVVHNYGREVNTDVFHTEIAKITNQPFYLIEDMAECHTSHSSPQSKAACWSFYKNKTLHGEEGGCVTFSQEYNAGYARSLRTIGFTKEHNYKHIPRGHNYRLADSLAKPILNNLKFLSTTLKCRKQIEDIYDSIFRNVYPFVIRNRSNTWVYDVRIPDMTKELQEIIVKQLQNIHPGVRYGFKQNSDQDEFKPSFVYSDTGINRTNSNTLSTEIISYPMQFVTYPPATIKKTIQQFYDLTTQLYSEYMSKKPAKSMPNKKKEK